MTPLAALGARVCIVTDRNPGGVVPIVGRASLSLSEALSVAGATRNAFNYWRRHGYLATNFSPKNGVAQELSHENCVDIALMATLTQVGMSPADAAPLIAKWLPQIRASHRMGVFERTLETDIPEGRKPRATVLINIDEVVARVTLAFFGLGDA